VPEKSTSTRAVFLDRDGVINRATERDGKPYPPRTIADFEIYPEVPGACAQLKAAGFILVVATNQPDVGRGTLDQAIVEKIHAHMISVLPIDRVEVCYHPGHGQSNCDCRKPKPGMVRAIGKRFETGLKGVPIVGDSLRDLQAGYVLGCTPYLVLTGKGQKTKEKGGLPPGTQVFPDLAAVTDYLLRQPEATSTTGA
jgi:D-glycero-D-manno-heptose 1,7-bisphosphate phosphatase